MASLANIFIWQLMIASITFLLLAAIFAVPGASRIFS